MHRYTPEELEAEKRGKSVLLALLQPQSTNTIGVRPKPIRPQPVRGAGKKVKAKGAPVPVFPGTMTIEEMGNALCEVVSARYPIQVPLPDSW